MKRRILFVDDESNVLDGLRGMLRAERDHWDMSFVVGADPAVYAAFAESVKELRAIRAALHDEAPCLAEMGCLS